MEAGRSAPRLSAAVDCRIGRGVAVAVAWPWVRLPWGDMRCWGVVGEAELRSWQVLCWQLRDWTGNEQADCQLQGTEVHQEEESGQ